MNLSYISKNYLFLLIPFTLLTGAFLADLLITIISLIFIKNYLIKKNYELSNSMVLKSFLCLYLILIVSVFFISPAPLIKQGTSIFFFRFGFFMLALHYFLMDKKNLYEFSKLFIIIFLFLSFDSIFQFFNGKNILGFALLAPHRVSSFFGNELIMGGFIVKIFPICMIFLSSLIMKEKKKNTIYFLVIISSFILIFLSGERTSLGMFLFQILFIIIFSKNFTIKKIFFFIFMIILIFYSVFNFASKKYGPDFKNIRYVNHLESMIGRFEHGIKDYIFIENKNLKIIKSHNGHYKTAYKIFDDNMFFGAGIKSFRYLCNDIKYKFNNKSCATHPHNTLLLFMSELGVLGLIIYFSFILTIIFDLIKIFFTKYLPKKLNTNYENYIFISGGILSTILPFLPNGNFFNNYMLIIFFILLSIYLSCRKILLIND